jgi:hypothetical protein
MGVITLEGMTFTSMFHTILISYDRILDIIEVIPNNKLGAFGTYSTSQGNYFGRNRRRD